MQIWTDKKFREWIGQMESMYQDKVSNYHYLYENRLAEKDAEIASLKIQIENMKNEIDNLKKNGGTE